MFFALSFKRERRGERWARAPAGFAAQLFDFFEQKSCAVVFFVGVFLFSVKNCARGPNFRFRRFVFAEISKFRFLHFSLKIIVFFRKKNHEKTNEFALFHWFILS